MAWTSPRTWVSAELITAAMANQHWRDNFIALYAGALSLASQAANDLPFCASATQLARIAAAANSVLVTSAVNVPSLSTTLPTAVQDSITRLGIIVAGSFPAANVTGTTIAAGSSLSGVNTGDNAANSLYTIGSQTQAYSARLGDLAAGVLWRQRNRIDANMTIPDGENAVMIGPFEVGPDVVVEGQGDSCFRGL